MRRHFRICTYQRERLVQLVDDGVDLTLKRPHHIVLRFGVECACDADREVADALRQRPFGTVHLRRQVEEALEHGVGHVQHAVGVLSDLVDGHLQ